VSAIVAVLNSEADILKEECNISSIGTTGKYVHLLTIKLFCLH
jgi:hypothetical protein